MKSFRTEIKLIVYINCEFLQNSAGRIDEIIIFLGDPHPGVVVEVAWILAYLSAKEDIDLLRISSINVIEVLSVPFDVL